MKTAIAGTIVAEQLARFGIVDNRRVQEKLEIHVAEKIAHMMGVLSPDNNDSAWSSCNINEALIRSHKWTVIEKGFGSGHRYKDSYALPKAIEESDGYKVALAEYNDGHSDKAFHLSELNSAQLYRAIRASIHKATETAVADGRITLGPTRNPGVTASKATYRKTSEF